MRFPQPGQVSANTSRTSSGASASLRATPGRPLRGFFSFPARFAFSPFDGGSEELPGVLGGTLRRASNSATRAVRAAFCSVRRRICSICAKTSATSSSLLSESTASGVIPSLNQSVTDQSIWPLPLSRARDARQGVSSYSDYALNKAHNRHFHIDDCISMGLKIEKLEDTPELQDLVLTVHHCFMN